MKRHVISASLIILSVFLLQSCAMLGEMARTLNNLERLQFRLQGVDDFSLAGIRISLKSQLRDFSVMDGIQLLAAFRAQRLMARFRLNVEALNPNDGSDGSTRTIATLARFDWRLLIDDQPTVSGGIDRPLEIPGTGQSSLIPLRMEIDLYEYFGDNGYNDLLNLALALGGRRGDISRVALDARPSVSTPLGDIIWPERITIISREFR
jgi:hypothetical protein